MAALVAHMPQMGTFQAQRAPAAIQGCAFGVSRSSLFDCPDKALTTTETDLGFESEALALELPEPCLSDDNLILLLLEG